MEHWDELWPGGFRFRFDDNVFKPSTDTFLLGDFAEVRRGERVCDLGAGIGLLGLLLLARQQELHITNIDIDSAACALAEENAAVNGLEDRVAVLRADLRDRTALPKAGSFDLCVANPPYFPPHTGRVAEGSRGTARSETACAFDQLCAAAAYLLRSGGRFCLVHRAERTAELMDVLRRHRLEPKVLRFVQKDAQTPPRLVLLSCRRHGGDWRCTRRCCYKQTAAKVASCAASISRTGGNSQWQVSCIWWPRPSATWATFRPAPQKRWPRQTSSRRRTPASA